MKVTIDGQACIGCGLCESICPAVFEMNGDGTAHVKNAEAAEEAGCREAADSCPTTAIVLE